MKHGLNTDEGLSESNWIFTKRTHRSARSSKFRVQGSKLWSHPDFRFLFVQTSKLPNEATAWGAVRSFMYRIWRRCGKLPNEPNGERAGQDVRGRIGFYQTNPFLMVRRHERNRNTDVNCMESGVYDEITKQTHALGAPVQGSKFNVKGCETNPFRLRSPLFELHNYQTKPMLDTPNIYL